MPEYKQPLPDVAIKCRECLLAFQAKEIDYEEFDRRLAIITVKYCLDDMIEKPMPTMPEEVRTYMKSNKLDRQKFLSQYPEFFKLKEVIEYFDNVARILNTNMRNYHELKRIKKMMQKPENVRAINRCLDTFQKTEEALQVKEGNVEAEEKVHDVMEVFGGVVKTAVPKHEHWQD